MFNVIRCYEGAGGGPISRKHLNGPYDIAYVSVSDWQSLLTSQNDASDTVTVTV